MISLEEIALENLLQSFPDYQERLYRLQKIKLQDEGLVIDITNFQHHLQSNYSSGGKSPYSQNFFLLTEEALGSSILFPKVIEKTFEEIFFFNWSHEYLHQFDQYIPIDHCPLLQMRNHTDLIMLFPKEELEISFFVGKDSLKGQWIGNSFFSLLKIQELESLIKTYGLKANIKIKSFSNERKFFEKDILDLTKAISQSWNIFYKLVNNPHYYKHIKSILKSFKKLTPELETSSEEIFYQSIKNLSFYAFKEFDTFDWRQLLFCFSVVGNFETQKRAERIKFIKKINFLENSGAFLPNNYSKVKPHLLFGDSYER